MSEVKTQTKNTFIPSKLIYIKPTLANLNKTLISFFYYKHVTCAIQDPLVLTFDTYLDANHYDKLILTPMSTLN